MQGAELRLLVGAAADGDLVELLAVLLDAENADVADVMMAAGVDAAGDVDVQLAEVAREVEIAEAPRQLLRDGNRARIGEAAVVEARAGDDVGDEADIRRGDADRIERPPQRRQVALGDMGQHEVLLVADPDLAERIAVGEIGDRVHLVGRRVARGAAFRLERQRHDRMAGHLVVGDGIAEPGVEAPVGAAQPRELGRIVVEPRIVRIAEARGDVGDHRGVERERAVLDRQPFRLDLFGEGFGAEIVHQDLDARLVDVVAPAGEIVDPQDRLDVAHEIALRQERLDRLAEERRAAEAAADHHLEAGLAGAVAMQPQPDVVDLDRRAVVARGGDGDLELARQEGEFRDAWCSAGAAPRTRCGGPRSRRRRRPPIDRW